MEIGCDLSGSPGLEDIITAPAMVEFCFTIKFGRSIFLTQKVSASNEVDKCVRVKYSLNLKKKRRPDLSEQKNQRGDGELDGGEGGFCNNTETLSHENKFDRHAHVTSQDKSSKKRRLLCFCGIWPCLASPHVPCWFQEVGIKL